MASARKKQDEKNLKTLRELVSLPHNKYCFDCNQRGPTYVNVTIGSFVCTKCSGMLRGLTPPHRVKSISMATFTPEEIDLIQNRGNDYCRRTWLGLYEGAPLTEARDEQQIHDLMVDKYERRRYYIEQPVSGNALSHGLSSNTNSNNSNNGGNSIAIPRATNGFKQVGLNGDHTAKHSPLRRLNNGMVANGAIVDNSRMKTNGITISRPIVPASMSAHSKGIDFVANFDSADIFNAANNSNNNNNNNNVTTNTSHRVNNNGVIANGVQSNHSVVQQQQQQQASFANFDNNPVFTNTTEDDFSIFDLQFSNNHGPMLNQVPLFPKCNASRWSVPNTNNLSQKNTANVPPAPPEDRYAALKDLDNALKNHQSAVDWSNSNSSSVYSSPTPTSSMYNSSSPQSLYGSPSQGQFISIFSQQETGSNSASNPFNSGQVWGNSSTIGTTATPLTNGMTNGSNPNPFRVAAPPSDPFKMNGYAQNFQQTTFAPINGSMWAANPFKVTTNGHSNNPFL